jgi:hypothetical protein
MKELLDEGLRANDLKNLINPVFEIDTFRSKMGEDSDVCVLDFKVKDRLPALDVMEFIEKSFTFVLDSDVSSGENNEGDYHVFVEIPRTKSLARQIEDITYGISKLSDINEWQFKYHKDKTLYDMSRDVLESVIPPTPASYQQRLNEVKESELKSFFNKTLMDDLKLENSIVTIFKPFNQQIKLQWLSEDDPQSILETAPSMDESSTAEIFWLTKVLGDYEISKFGDKLLFTNGQRSMLLKRIES